jgi:branched-chain amino acid transport system ATP-binding protein
LERPSLHDASPDGAVSARPGSDGVVSNDILRVEGLYGGYGRKQVVFDVSFHVGHGEVVTLLGHNGSGKSTTIKTIHGVLPPHRGTVWYSGHDITGNTARRTVKAGMAMIPSERFVFADLTVMDNLLLGGANTRDVGQRERRLAEIYELFPILRERSGQRAGTMSGGQQRMVSLGIALMGSPKLLMLDEPSLGLAPRVVESLFDSVKHLTKTEGLSVLLLEQNVAQTLRIIDRAYVMRSGRMILEETVDQMRARGSYWDLF